MVGPHQNVTNKFKRKQQGVTLPWGLLLKAGPAAALCPCCAGAGGVICAHTSGPHRAASCQEQASSNLPQPPLGHPCREKAGGEAPEAARGSQGEPGSPGPGARRLGPSSCPNSKGFGERVFSSSIFISSNLRPKETSTRAVEGSEPGRMDPASKRETSKEVSLYVLGQG